jgi:hypothetical protein
MKKAHDGARFPEAGTVTYIVSTKWVDAYKDYCFWSSIRLNQVPDPSEGHFEKTHPGKVSNADVLNLDEKYLKGTGKLKGFDTEVIDTYLHKNMREKTNYEFWSEDLWKFVKSRYDCDHEIKRFYHK